MYFDTTLSSSEKESDVDLDDYFVRHPTSTHTDVIKKIQAGIQNTNKNNINIYYVENRKVDRESKIY